MVESGDGGARVKVESMPLWEGGRAGEGWMGRW